MTCAYIQCMYVYIWYTVFVCTSPSCHFPYITHCTIQYFLFLLCTSYLPSTIALCMAFLLPLSPFSYSYCILFPLLLSLLLSSLLAFSCLFSSPRFPSPLLLLPLIYSSPSILLLPSFIHPTSPPTPLPSPFI